MRPYHDLTKRGKTRRLRALATAALSQWGLSGRLRLLRDAFNAIFRLDADDGRRLVVRVHRGDFRQPEEVGSELAWLAALARDGIDWVPAPVVALNGDLHRVVSHPGVPKPRAVSVLTWLPGRVLAGTVTADAMRRFGARAAHLHRHAAALDPVDFPGFERADRLFNGRRCVLDDASLIPDDDRRALLADAMAFTEAGFAERRARGDAVQICHGDLHLWNAHRDRRGTIYVLDFDDACVTWPAYDLGISRFYVLAQAGEERGPGLWDAFATGYTDHAPWPADGASLRLFRVARQLYLLNTLLQSDDRELVDYAAEYAAKSEARLRSWLAAA